MMTTSRSDETPESVFGHGRWFTTAEIETWERTHGTKPIGYRATGPVWWFLPTHGELGPCRSCGRDTGRWLALETLVVDAPEGEGNPTYKGRSIASRMVPECWPCARAAAMRVLVQRQQNLAIDESVRVGEARYLAELGAEQQQEAA